MPNTNRLLQDSANGLEPNDTVNQDDIATSLAAVSGENSVESIL